MCPTGHLHVPPHPPLAGEYISLHGPFNESVVCQNVILKLVLCIYFFCLRLHCKVPCYSISTSVSESLMPCLGIWCSLSFYFVFQIAVVNILGFSWIVAQDYGFILARPRSTVCSTPLQTVSREGKPIF